MARWPRGFGSGPFRSMHTEVLLCRRVRYTDVVLFFLGFSLVSSFVQVFEMLFVLISLSKRFNSIYACPRVHKTHNGHAFMISMNESKIYNHVHETRSVQFCLVFGNSNGGIMSFTKRLCEGYKN